MEGANEAARFELCQTAEVYKRSGYARHSPAAGLRDIVIISGEAPRVGAVISWHKSPLTLWILYSFCEVPYSYVSYYASHYPPPTQTTI